MCGTTFSRISSIVTAFAVSNRFGSKHSTPYFFESSSTERLPQILDPQLVRANRLLQHPDSEYMVQFVRMLFRIQEPQNNRSIKQHQFNASGCLFADVVVVKVPSKYCSTAALDSKSQVLYSSSISHLYFILLTTQIFVIRSSTISGPVVLMSRLIYLTLHIFFLIILIGSVTFPTSKRLSISYV